MTTIRGHFDGKVIIPSEPVDLPRGRELLLHVDDTTGSVAPDATSGGALLHFAGAGGAHDLQQMNQAIAEGCEQEVQMFLSTGRPTSR